jgi:L-lysine 2,3-aminomutase
VLSERIDADFLALFDHFPFHKVMILHVNHPNELNKEVHTALSALKNAGFTLLNQSVLLKGINDTIDVQVALQRKLFSFGVLPYYLHLPDRAKGTAHFDVSLTDAQRILAGMTLQLPGYLVPKLAREVPGLGAKEHL